MNVQKIRALWKARKDVIIDLKVHLSLICFRKEWRALNSHNGTSAVNTLNDERYLFMHAYRLCNFPF